MAYNTYMMAYNTHTWKEKKNLNVIDPLDPSTNLQELQRTILNYVTSMQ